MGELLVWMIYRLYYIHYTTYKAHKKNEKISRSNQFGQNATIFYRKQLFRLDPKISGLCLQSVKSDL